MPALNQSLDEARKQYGETFSAFRQAMAGLVADYKHLVDVGMIPSPGDWSELEEAWGDFEDAFGEVYHAGRKRNEKPVKPSVLDELAKAAEGFGKKDRSNWWRGGVQGEPFTKEALDKLLAEFPEGDEQQLWATTPSQLAWLASMGRLGRKPNGDFFIKEPGE